MAMKPDLPHHIRLIVTVGHQDIKQVVHVTAQGSDGVACWHWVPFDQQGLRHRLDAIASPEHGYAFIDSTHPAYRNAIVLDRGHTPRGLKAAHNHDGDERRHSRKPDEQSNTSRPSDGDMAQRDSSQTLLVAAKLHQVVDALRTLSKDGAILIDRALVVYTDRIKPEDRSREQSKSSMSLEGTPSPVRVPEPSGQRDELRDWENEPAAAGGMIAAWISKTLGIEVETVNALEGVTSVEARGSIADTPLRRECARTIDTAVRNLAALHRDGTDSPLRALVSASGGIRDINEFVEASASLHFEDGTLSWSPAGAATFSAVELLEHLARAAPRVSVTRRTETVARARALLRTGDVHGSWASVAHLVSVADVNSPLLTPKAAHEWLLGRRISEELASNAYVAPLMAAVDTRSQGGAGLEDVLRLVFRAEIALQSTTEADIRWADALIALVALCDLACQLRVPAWLEAARDTHRLPSFEWVESGKNAELLPDVPRCVFEQALIELAGFDRKGTEGEALNRLRRLVWPSRDRGASETNKSSNPERLTIATSLFWLEIDAPEFAVVRRYNQRISNQPEPSLVSLRTLRNDLAHRTFDANAVDRIRSNLEYPTQPLAMLTPGASFDRLGHRVLKPKPSNAGYVVLDDVLRDLGIADAYERYRRFHAAIDSAFTAPLDVG